MVKRILAGLLAAAALGVGSLAAAQPTRLSIGTGGTGGVYYPMGGGMAAPDTFDPKKYVPFEVGLPVGKVESTFPTIDTVVDDIRITQGLENIAQVMDRASLIRSRVLPDLGSILHSRHRVEFSEQLAQLLEIADLQCQANLRQAP